MSRLFCLVVASLGTFGCRGGDDEGGADPTDIVVPDEPVPGVTTGCGSVRLTTYDASHGSGWCEFANHHAILPDFVRRNLTLAISEPYNGSSYGGRPGEACGECWEIDSLAGTEVVMVNNLCPIKGNPLCAGGHFHFDLSEEAGAALDGGGLDEAQVRRVPCPVSGNIHAQINDRNEWGYLRLAFINHRFPIRRADFRAADGDEWWPVERSGGAWHVRDGGEVFAKDGPGGVFRFTSATGERVEGSAVLGYDAAVDSVFDTGIQFAAEPVGQACEFVPPAAVFDEGWGGIDQVRWTPNPWSGVSMAVVHDECADGSACVQVNHLKQWSGFHIYYRKSFPTSTFQRLSLQLRTVTGTTELVVSPSHDGERCEETKVEVGEDWTRVELELASACGELAELSALTVSNHGAAVALLVDEIRFE